MPEVKNNHIGAGRGKVLHAVARKRRPTTPHHRPPILELRAGDYRLQIGDLMAGRIWNQTAPHPTASSLIVFLGLRATSRELPDRLVRLFRPPFSSAFVSDRPFFSHLPMCKKSFHCYDDVRKSYLRSVEILLRPRPHVSLP